MFRPVRQVAVPGRSLQTLTAPCYHKNKTGFSFFVVKATVLKQQIFKFYPQINAKTLTGTFISVIGLS